MVIGFPTVIFNSVEVGVLTVGRLYNQTSYFYDYFILDLFAFGYFMTFSKLRINIPIWQTHYAKLYYFNNYISNNTYNSLLFLQVL